MAAIAAPSRRGRFRVTEGIHVEQDGRVYRKGNVLESADDLTERFKNKFERVDLHTPLTKVPVSFVKPTEAGNPLAVSTLNRLKAQGLISPEDWALLGAAITGGGPKQHIPPMGVDTESEPAGPTGADVTAKFPIAVENDYKVYKQGGKYFVYDADDLTAAINPTGVGKADVASVVEGAMGPADESGPVDSDDE